MLLPIAGQAKSSLPFCGSEKCFFSYCGSEEMPPFTFCGFSFYCRSLGVVMSTS